MSRPISFERAKAQYLHRYTLEHVPEWARKINPGNGKYYAPQYRTDAEWYELTTFPGENGHPRNEDHCLSNGQTWPCGQWLDHLVGAGFRTDCGHGRVAYRPDWDKSQPYATYIDGTAGRHFASLEACAQYFAAKGMYLKQGAAPQKSFTAYVQHGSGTQGPFRTERAPVRRKESKPGNPAKAGPIATHYELKTAGRWRRLFVSSGTPSHFVTIDRKRVPVTIVEGVE